MNSFVVQNGVRESAKIMGVSKMYFDIYNLKLAKGSVFNEIQEENGLPVCIIGDNIRAKFFAVSLLSMSTCEASLRKQER